MVAELLKAATLAFLDIFLEEYDTLLGRSRQHGGKLCSIQNAAGGSCIGFLPGCVHTVAVQELCLHDMILGHMK